jgi:hypothetical protein
METGRGADARPGRLDRVVRRHPGAGLLPARGAATGEQEHDASSPAIATRSSCHVDPEPVEDEPVPIVSVDGGVGSDAPVSPETVPDVLVVVVVRFEVVEVEVVVVELDVVVVELELELELEVVSVSTEDVVVVVSWTQKMA